MHFMRPHFIFIICTISLLERTFAMSNGDLRLTGGTKTTGWVEIYYDYRWNTVSDQFLIYDISSVVCRQLGLPFTGAETIYNPTMPRPDDTMKVWSSTAFCDGDEARFVDCSSFSWSVSNYYTHDNDVAVQCKGEYIRTGDIRLADGSDQLRGRLEIFQRNQWDSLCSVGFGTTEATVACRQLGLLTSISDAVVYPDAYFGQGNGAGTYTAHCNGYEERVDSCNLYLSFNSDIYDEMFCSHSQNVGICCPRVAGECATSTTTTESSTVGGVIASILVVVIVLSIICCCCYCCCKKKKAKQQYTAVEVNPPAQAAGGAPQVSFAPSGNTDPPVYYHGATPGNPNAQPYPAQYPSSGQALPPPASGGSTPYPSQPAPYPTGQVPAPVGAYPAPHQPGYNPTAAASMQYPPQQAAAYPPQPAAPYPPPAAAPYPSQSAATYPPQPAAPYPPQTSAAQPYSASSAQPMSYPHPEAMQASAGQSYPTKGDPDHPLPPSHTATESPSAPPMDISSGHDVTPSAPPPAYEHLIA